MHPLNSHLLRFVIRPCLAIIPFLVLLVVKGYTYSPYVAARSVAFRVLTEALFIAWVILAIREPRYRPRKNPLFIAFAVFLAIQLISAILGEDFSKSFWGTLLHMEGLVTYLHLFAYILVLSSVLNSHEQWKHHFNLHLAAGFLWAGFCFGEWLAGDRGYRVESLLGNSIYAATYSYFMIFISGMLLMQKKRETARTDFFRIGYFISIAIHLVLIILTGTRGALLGLFISFLAMTGLAIFLLKTNRLVKRLSVAAISLVAAGGITLVAFRDSPVVKETPILARLVSTTSDQSAVKARLISWRAALEGARERPVLGWGMGNFHLVMSKYYDPLLHDHAQWFDRAHNVFLDWLIAGGVPGLLAYLFILASLYWLIWKGRHRLPLELKIILAGLLTGYFAQLFFGFDSIMSLILLGTIAAFIASTISDSLGGEPQKNPKKTNRQTAVKALAAYLLGTITITLLLNYPIMKSSVLLTKARWYQSPEGPAENIAMFNDLLHPRTFAQPETTEEFFNYVTTAVNVNNTPPQKRLEYLSMVTREFDAEIERKPLDPRVLWFAARTRIEMGDFYQAIIYMRKAKTLAPRMPILLSTLAQAYFLSNDYVNTERELEYLYSLAPTNATAKAAYIQILQLNGKMAEAAMVARK